MKLSKYNKLQDGYNELYQTTWNNKLYNQPIDFDNGIKFINWLYDNNKPLEILYCMIYNKYECSRCNKPCLGISNNKTRKSPKKPLLTFKKTFPKTYKKKISYDILGTYFHNEHIIFIFNPSVGTFLHEIAHAVLRYCYNSTFHNKTFDDVNETLNKIWREYDS